MTMSRSNGHDLWKCNFFGVTDQVSNGTFSIQWHPGQENLADYFTKHFESKHHQEVRPWYLHMHNSPRFLPRAVAPSTLRGCVGRLPNGYHRTAPLPRVNPSPSRVKSRVQGPSTCSILSQPISATAIHRLLSTGHGLIAMAS